MTRAFCILGARRKGPCHRAEGTQKAAPAHRLVTDIAGGPGQGEGNQAAIALLPKVLVRISRSKGFSRKSVAPARLPAIITFSSASTTQ